MNLLRSTVILLAVIFLPALSHAQKSYTFKVKYEPNTTYKTTMDNVGVVIHCGFISSIRFVLIKPQWIMWE